MRSEDTRVTWTQKIKEELIEVYSKSVKSRKAELSAIVALNSQAVRYDALSGLYIFEEANAAGKNNFTDRHKTYNINGRLDFTRDPKDLYKDMDSKRAFLRGAFIAVGSFTDPNKSYQFELVTDYEWQAAELSNLMQAFAISSRIMERRDKYVVYIKDGQAIADILNVMGAHKALMEFENVRILKDVRQSVNRQVNCETANINKTIAASMKQLEDIRLIDAVIGIDNLDENTRNICRIRMEHPDAGLSELGDLMTPPLGKSGVNHRFRKLSQMAENIRKQQEKR